MKFSIAALGLIMPFAFGSPTNLKQEFEALQKLLTLAESQPAHQPIALANTKERCFWSGTAPFCEGACPNGWKEVDSNDHGDGNSCATGEKKKCCRTFNLDNCYWAGTAPFCSGGCNDLEEYTRSWDNCGDGKCCSTGQKAQCCHPA